MTLIIENLDLLVSLNQESEIFSDVSIVIRDGEIVEIGSPEKVSKDYDFDEKIDGSGKVAIPGFVDTHTHSYQAFLRGFIDEVPGMLWLRKLHNLEEEMTEEMYQLGSTLSFIEKLKGGVTTTVDMILDVEPTLKAAEEIGIRTVISEILYDRVELAGARGEAPDLESEVKRASKNYKKYHGRKGGLISYIFSPVGFPASSPDLLELSAQKARELGARIHTHAGETKVARRLCERKHGKGEIELLEDLNFLSPDAHLAHCVQIDKNEIRVLAKHGVGVAHCPSSNLKLANGVAPISELLKEGALVSIGVDGAASNNEQNMLSEIKLASLLQKGTTENAGIISSKKALEMVAVNGAKSIGRGDEIGSIEVGKKADLNMIDLDDIRLLPKRNIVSHLAFSSSGLQMNDVIVDGDVIIKDKEFQTLDESSVIDRAEKMFTDFIEENKDLISFDENFENVTGGEKI